MKEGDFITVALGDETVRAMVYYSPVFAPPSRWTAWAKGDDRSGPLGTEGVHYVRGWLYPRWWPPHRRRANALISSAALAGAVSETLPKPPNPHVPVLSAAVMDMGSRLLQQQLQRIRAKLPVLPELPGSTRTATTETTAVTVNGREVGKWTKTH